jgi:hypothetical protein
MKTLLRSTLYTALIAIGFFGGLSLSLPGCKPEVDNGQPEPQPTIFPDVQTGVIDGIASTTVTFPDAMSTLTYPGPNAPQPPANCRIVRTIYRSYYSLLYDGLGQIEGIERFYIRTPTGPVIDNVRGTPRDYKPVFIYQVTTFQYDNQGRLVQEARQNWDIPADTTRYQYEVGRILFTRSYWNDSKRRIDRDTLPLDSRGLSRVSPYTYRYGYFDEAGYLVLGNWNKQEPQARRIRRQIVDGNVRLYTDSLSGWGLTKIRVPHYVQHPNLPDRVPFHGTKNRHLLAEEIQAMYQNRYYADGDKYLTRYIYLFDTQGRVSRQIAFGKPLSNAWPFHTHNGDIGITDYEYACP